MTSPTDTLRARHRQLERMIHDEQAKALPDTLRIAELKRYKLHIKDALASRQFELTPADLRRKYG